MRKFLKAASAAVLALTLAVNFTPIQNLQAETIEDVAEETADTASVTITQPVVGTQYYHYQNILYTSWEDGYLGGIMLRNDSDTEFTISDWYLQFNYSDGGDVVQNVYNAEFVSSDNGTYTVKCPSWDTTLEHGETYYIFFLVDGDNPYAETQNVTLYGDVTFAE